MILFFKLISLRLIFIYYFLSVTSGLENFALAQHCFIKSIQSESNVCEAHLFW